MASQIDTTIRAVSVISPKRDEVSTPAEQNAFVVSAETTYDEIALQLVSDLNDFGDEANILSTEVSANATSAEQDALIAQSVVNSKGAWSGLTGALNIPASVTHTGSVWVLNVNIADVTLSEPTDVNTDWTEVSGVTQAELDAVASDVTDIEKIDKTTLVTPPTDVDYTLTADENLYGRIEIDTTNWTIARNIITDNIEHTFLAVVNTTGSQNATFKTSAGTGIAVPTGEERLLRNDTVNIIHQETTNTTLWDKQTLTINFTSNADLILTAEQERYGKIILTDTGVVLTTARNVIFSTKQKDFIVQNDTIQTLTHKTSAGTGIAILTTAKTWLFCDGTDIVESIDTAEGKVLQELYDEYTTYSSSATIIPLDDTIPQNTEGTEWLSVTITPKSATSILRIQALVNQCPGTGSWNIMALFRDSGANALRATQIYSSTNEPLQVTLLAEIASGSTAETTLKIRTGNSVGICFINGNTSARQFGGSAVCTLTITEVEV